MSKPSDPLRQVQGHMRAMQKALLLHTADFNDTLSSSLVDPLLFAAAEAKGIPRHRIHYDEWLHERARKAAEILAALPEDTVSETIRRRKQLPETKRKLWEALLNGIMRSGGPTLSELGEMLLAPRNLTSDENKVLRECLKKGFEHVTEHDARPLLEVLRDRPKKYNLTVFRAILQAVARNGSAESLEALVD